MNKYFKNTHLTTQPLLLRMWWILLPKLTGGYCYLSLLADIVTYDYHLIPLCQIQKTQLPNLFPISKLVCLVSVSVQSEHAVFI